MRTPTSDILLDRMMSLHPKLIDLTLDRVWRLLEALGHPERQLPPVVHVAGTNGKGSTVAMIRAGLEGAGETCHVYTSPHLARFHERIRVAGELISEEAFIKVLDECWETNQRQEITFFEITTVAALLAFARTPADLTLLEVGLGGRLDATNVVEKPRVTVITPVDYDHQQYLGETIPEIAFEKAGIIKRGVPCVVGPQHEAGLAVIERQAAKMGAPVLAYGQHWHVGEERGRLVYQDDHGLLDLPPPNLPGPHQFLNAGAAIAVLRHLGYGEDACAAAVTQAYWPARMQRMKHGPLVEAAGAAELWLDGGHNPSAGAVIADTIRRMPARPTHLICGMLRTKDPVGFLTHLRPVAQSLTSIAIPGETATLSAEETAKAGETAGFPARIAASPLEAVREIVAEDSGARILICGSLYLAGSVLRENG